MLRPLATLQWRLNVPEIPNGLSEKEMRSDEVNSRMICPVAANLSIDRTLRQSQGAAAAVFAGLNMRQHNMA
jgi:hypothetical protein